jgi:hypothetical protein
VRQWNGNLGNGYFQGNPVKTLASIPLMNSMFGDYKTKTFPTMKCSLPRPKVWFDMVLLKLTRVKSFKKQNIFYEEIISARTNS